MSESEWTFDEVPLPEGEDSDLVCIGADLAPSTLVSAYSNSFFPMPIGGRKKAIGWFSPDPRGVVPIGGLRVSRSLRKHLRRFRYSVDTCFERVMRECGDERRPHGWIDDDFVHAYSELNRSGWAHSVEVWQDDELVGGVYGVRIERFFAGESMFHRATDASKAALVALMEILVANDFELFDVQWTTPHLVSLGAVDLSRTEYREALRSAIRPARRGNSAGAPTD
ncbi:MAG: leucyl/phenylalanyl-tRNA--protein transferase [Ilumatobacteraceae bacterium]